MARFFNYLLLSVCLVAALVSCQNGDDVGELYGQWKLESKTGGETIDLESSYAYWLCFQGDVVSLRKTNERNHTYQEVFGNNTFSDDQLSIQFVAINKAVNDTLLVEKTLELGNFTSVNLHIDRLDGKRMDLSRQDGISWHFIKW